MSTPRDRDADGFDDSRNDGTSGWQEPAHLGGAEPGATPADRPAERPAEPPADGPGAGRAPEPWQPPGWDLPAVEPDRTVPQPSSQQQPPAPSPWPVPPVDRPAEERPRGRGLFGSRRDPGPNPGRDEAGFPIEQPNPVPPADPWGTQAWAMNIGWVLSDGTAPQDAPLAELVQSAPVRPGKDDRAGQVLRGRGNGLDLVAFDVLSPLGRGREVSTHAITAAPVLGTVPGFRLSPARMWRHGTGGLVQVPSPDQEFDRRWLLLATEDGPQVRRLVDDPVVRQLLLGSDDGDELWSAAGFVAAVRPDGNRPQLIEHHARLLAAVVGALAAAG